MKKTEKLTTVEGFMLAKNISLDQFYDVRIGPNQITLQGKFDTSVTKELAPLMTLTLTDYGYLVGEINIPIESSEEVINVRIVLT